MQKRTRVPSAAWLRCLARLYSDFYGDDRKFVSLTSRLSLNLVYFREARCKSVDVWQYTLSSFDDGFERLLQRRCRSSLTVSLTLLEDYEQEFSAVDAMQ
mmetsp:Transcript_39822/g.59067  ORF Transcript_39822/g.59067 Transcript_39822/m.59067 type:complete len:100 (-) Transcript_39822:848-1147(-)